MNNERGTAKTGHQNAERAIDLWLHQYSLYHQNSLNKRLHHICVPLIVLSILGLLWSIPVPSQVANWGPWFNVATAVMLITSLYYLRLSRNLAVGMLLLASASTFLINYAEQLTGLKAWQWAIPLFIVAWIGQFIGHHFEGKRPAFVNDLQFLLIGPLWILAHLYRGLGLAY